MRPHTHPHLDMQNTLTDLCAHMQVHTTHTHTCTYRETYTYTLHIHTCMPIHLWIYIEHIHMHTYTHTHAGTQHVPIRMIYTIHTHIHAHTGEHKITLNTCTHKHCPRFVQPHQPFLTPVPCQSHYSLRTVSTAHPICVLPQLLPQLLPG